MLRIQIKSVEPEMPRSNNLTPRITFRLAVVVTVAAVLLSSSKRELSLLEDRELLGRSDEKQAEHHAKGRH